MVVVFLKIGMQVQWQGDMTVSEMVNEGVRRGYSHPDNLLRFSMVSDPLGKRKNTLDNTPAIVHTQLVKGDKVEIKIAAKGGGSENKTRFKVLNPSDSLVDWVLDEVPKMGAGWCPPGMLGIGVGGSAEQAMLPAADGAWSRQPQGGAAPGALRQGQRPGHRRPGARRPDHRARRQDQRLSHPRRLPAGGHDP
jgi:fumarate hydratase class I